jgi:DNA-binding NarL/FixJ family response regulator
MHDESLFAERALRAGAKGYIMKQEDHREELDAIRRVLNGGLYISKGSARISYRNSSTANPKAHHRTSGPERPRARGLFNSSARVFGTRQIADELQ